MRTVLAIAFVCFFGLITVSAGEKSADSTDEILATYNDWVEATNAKDIDQWSTFVSPGAIFFPPGVPALDSREAMVGFYTRSFDDPHFSLDCAQTFVEVADSNDLAWSRGTCDATFSLPDGSVVRGSSKWAKVWIRSQDGEWKCQVNTWNTNQ
jgi:ketosteroid isomerase-like protein